MKKIISLISLIFSITFLYAETPLKVGDNYLSVENNSVLLQSGQIYSLFESYIELLAPTKNLDHEDIVLVKINKKKWVF